jgi:hypothetical protein
MEEFNEEHALRLRAALEVTRTERAAAYSDVLGAFCCLWKKQALVRRASSSRGCGSAVAEEELASEKYMAYLGEKSRSQTGYISSSGIRSW